MFHMHPTVRTNFAPLPPALPPEHLYAYRTGGRVDDVELWGSITRDTVIAGPDWWPSQPLPLSFTDGETIARGELRKLVHDEPSWELTDISLHRLLDRRSTKWHCAFHFMATDATDDRGWHHDQFTVHVNLAGTPGATGLRVGD